ncbi:MAG: hypothetical protein KC680_00530 [Candidatus Peregrinibacteria bacterium]|nr:hypothetical protein [Candidatus Peregrinibacteria bacterium]MCB9807849.1 hypothetical protein [Candidatus Peribacteria bacterium]
MPSKKESALAKVQSLYLMQVELWNFLDDKDADASKVKTAQKTLQEFKTLLKEVDWQYMGGEDVLASLQWIPGEVNQKLKKAPKKKKVVAVVRKSAKKPAKTKKKKVQKK